jgi:hypothetical protein
MRAGGQRSVLTAVVPNTGGDTRQSAKERRRRGGGGLGCVARRWVDAMLRNKNKGKREMGHHYVWVER